MANIHEDDKTAVGECEATYIMLPCDFFGNTHFEAGDWAQEIARPEHIGGTADWAVYPTQHFPPNLETLALQEEVAATYGIKRGRNEEQIEILKRFRDGNLSIADIGDFDASMKPVPVPALPYWWFVRSEKDEIGRDYTVKTARLQTKEDVLRLTAASGALTSAILKQGKPIGVIDRIIIKYRLAVGENGDGKVYVPADMRVDMQYCMHMREGHLNISPPAYLTSVECELQAEGADPDALRRGMNKINRTLLGRGGLKTHLRFGRYSLTDNPKEYVRDDLQKLRPTLTDAAFESLYDRMQAVGRQVWERYGKGPDSINRQVRPANPREMKELQRVNGRF